MKISYLLVFVILCSAFVIPRPPQEDRSLLLTQLKETKANLLKEVAGLSEEQLKYKPAPDRWSVIECVEHIYRTEGGLFAWEQQLVSAPADASKRSLIKLTDEQIIAGVEDRSKKAKAPEEFVPAGGQTSQQIIAGFVARRDSLINYVMNSKDDLRNHVVEQSPLGPIDAYQLLLLDAAHTNRHTQQLVEVKNSAGFPK
ncbi:DinB superfamily protein [Chitinophaga jiangningensis]|uniref:DinB superfamily protein n=1 Tax=Chitinophaga jiangningensis TaxID=1419482 RepID=A0A1M6VG08_9BACT|nr:DinB family protein [Chitinophaga jiangningensis]SHK80399.1 DinB superfamily protein [Chitinophaga jiangningensis]